MSMRSFKPVRNTALPSSFKQIRLELAREPNHPEGDSKTNYIIVAPLDADGRIDPALWKIHRDACRVVRSRPNDQDNLGHVVHRPGGSWAFKYDVTGDADEEVGYHFADERFILGEYVSIKQVDQVHAFRVVAVAPL